MATTNAVAELLAAAVRLLATGLRLTAEVIDCATERIGLLLVLTIIAIAVPVLVAL